MYMFFLKILEKLGRKRVVAVQGRRESATQSARVAADGGEAEAVLARQE